MKETFGKQNKELKPHPWIHEYFPIRNRRTKKSYPHVGSFKIFFKKTTLIVVSTSFFYIRDKFPSIRVQT